MRYLKKFESNEDGLMYGKFLMNKIHKKIIDNICSDIDDILLELNDSGYYSNVSNVWASKESFEIEIEISKDERFLNYLIDETDNIENMSNVDINWNFVEVMERVLQYSEGKGLIKKTYDINDNYDRNQELTDIGNIETDNLKKISIILEFKY